MGNTHLIAYFFWQVVHGYFCIVGTISDLSVLIYSAVLYNDYSDLNFLAIFLLCILALMLHMSLFGLMFYKHIHIKYLHIVNIGVFLGSSLFQGFTLFVNSICENFQDFCIFDCFFLVFSVFNGVSIGICFFFFIEQVENDRGLIVRRELAESTETDVSYADQEI